MQRARRGRDNAALDHAIALGRAPKLPVVAGFGLPADYPGAHGRFLTEGPGDAADLEAKSAVAARPDHRTVPGAVAIWPENAAV